MCQASNHVGLGWTHYSPTQTTGLCPAHLKKHKEEKQYVGPLISPTRLGRVKPVMARLGLAQFIFNNNNNNNNNNNIIK
jgi:hypothetical protein